MNEMLKSVLSAEELIKYEKLSGWAKAKIQILANSVFSLKKLLNQDNKPTSISVRDSRENLRYLDEDSRIQIEVPNGQIELCLHDNVLKIFSVKGDGLAVIPQANNYIHLHVTARNFGNEGAEYVIGKKKA